MKRIITLFISVTLFFLYFISCKSTDVQPNSSMVVKSISNRFISPATKKTLFGSKISFEYLGSDLIKTSLTDTNYSETPPIIRSVTQNVTHKDKIPAKSLVIEKNLKQTNQIEYNIKKIANGFEISSKVDLFKEAITQIEVNSNNQMTKYKKIKSIYFDPKGQPSEKSESFIQRYEYDTKGNIVKVFSNLNSTKEYLIAELTYDSNPNPWQAVKWVYKGRLYESFPQGESKNNPISVKTYKSSGELGDVYVITHIYNKNTFYPTSSIWSQSFDGKSVKSTSTYTFVY